jgi:hypothetical protein
MKAWVETVMDNVIFLGDRRAARQDTPLAPDQTAEIIIFQGVRIERLTDDMIEQAKLRLRRLPSLQNHATAEELD